MKKQILLLMAGGAMIVSSCNQPAGDNGSQAQIDSMVNARVEEIRAEMMAHNDSLINELAQYRADSIIAAMSGKKVYRPKPKAKAPVVNATTSEEAAATKAEENKRPGATNSGGVKKSTDRPGATNSGGEKKASDRPGAN